MDLIGYVCYRATQKFGGNDGVFNAAGFSNAFESITGIKKTMDGNEVLAILWGRKDVEILNRSHYRLKTS
jgi:hypothetical protein